MKTGDLKVILIILVISGLGFFAYRRMAQRSSMARGSTLSLAPQPNPVSTGKPAPQGNPSPVETLPAPAVAPPLPQEAPPTKKEISEDEKKMAKAMAFMKLPPGVPPGFSRQAALSSESAARKALSDIPKCLSMNLPKEGFPPEVMTQLESAQKSMKASCEDTARQVAVKYPRLRKDVEKILAASTDK